MIRSERKRRVRRAVAPGEDVFRGAEVGSGGFDESDRAGGTAGVGTPFFAIAQNGGTNREKIKNAGRFCARNERSCLRACNGGNPTNDSLSAREAGRAQAVAEGYDASCAVSREDDELEFCDSLDVVILDSRRTGVRFGKDGGVVCRTRNGVDGPSGMKCRQCAYYPFNRQSTAEDDERCRSGMLLLCVAAGEIDAVEVHPFFLQLGAGAIKDWQAYASLLQDRHERPVFSCVTRVTTVERASHNNLHFVPVFTPVRALTACETKGMRHVRMLEARRFEWQEPAVSDQ